MFLPLCTYIMHKACSGCPAPRLVLRARLAIALGKPRAWEHVGKEKPGAPNILIKLSPRRCPLTPVGRMGKLIDPKLGPVQCTGVRDSIRVDSIRFDSIRFDSIWFDSWITWLTIGNNSKC